MGVCVIVCMWAWFEVVQMGGFVAVWGVSMDRPNGRKSGTAGLVNGVLLAGRRWPADTCIPSSIKKKKKKKKKKRCQS